MSKEEAERIFQEQLDRAMARMALTELKKRCTAEYDPFAAIAHPDPDAHLGAVAE